MMNFFYFKPIYIFIFIVLCFLQINNISAYGNHSVKNQISYNLEPLQTDLPIEPIKYKPNKKINKKQNKNLTKKKQTPNTGEWIFLNIIHVLMKIYSWIFIATTFVLWLLMEAGTYGTSSFLGWLIVIIGFLYSGLVLIGVLDALKFTKWTRLMMKWNRADNYEMYYGSHISIALILFLCTSYFIIFPILLFVINWSISAEVILIFSLAIAALVLYIIMLNKAKKIMDNEDLPNSSQNQPIKQNTSPIYEDKKPSSSEEYFQD